MYLDVCMYVRMYVRQIAKIMAENISTYEQMKGFIFSLYSQFNSQKRYATCFLVDSLATLMY